MLNTEAWGACQAGGLLVSPNRPGADWLTVCWRWNGVSAGAGQTELLSGCVAGTGLRHWLYFLHAHYNRAWAATSLQMNIIIICCYKTSFCLSHSLSVSLTTVISHNVSHTPPRNHLKTFLKNLNIKRTKHFTYLFSWAFISAQVPISTFLDPLLLINSQELLADRHACPAAYQTNQQQYWKEKNFARKLPCWFSWKHQQSSMPK